MENIWNIVDQLEEAKKLISLGKTSSLRMALLLLDNTAEILMHREVMDLFFYEEFYKRLDKYAKTTLPDNAYKQWRQTEKIRFIETKRMQQIDKSFDAKIKYLSENNDRIKKPLAKALNFIHRYRNEAYHREHIRKEILRPIVILFFEFVCDLFVDLWSGSYSFKSTDNWHEYFVKYKISEDHSFQESDLELISNKLKEGAIIDFQSLKTSLKTNLKNRFADALENIKFLKGERIGSKINLPIDELKFIKNNNIIFEDRIDKELKEIVQEFNFHDWVKRINELDIYVDKCSLFNVYASIEKEFEAIEYKIQYLADKLDSWIQLQIDIDRVNKT